MTTLRILVAFGLMSYGFALTALAQNNPISLSEAIERSLDNATHSRIAKADKEAAEAAGNLLSSDYLPKVNSSMSYTRSQYPQIVTPIRAQGAFPPLDDQIYEGNIQADWEIFDFGESRAMRQKAKTLADAANVKYELAKMEVIEATASGFIQLQQLRELKLVQEERIEALKTNKSQLESLYSEGRVAKVDLLKIEDAIVEAESEIIATKNNINQVLVRLSDDLGMDHKLSLENIPSLSFDNDYQFNPDHIPEENIPSVAAANRQKQAADFEAKASYRAFLPQVNLFAVEQLRAGSNLEIDDQWMVGIQLSIPLFTGKKVVNRQIKKKEAKSQQIQLEQTRQQFRQQLNKLSNAQFETQKRIQATQTRTEYLEETYRMESKSYTQGRSTLTDLLTTESKLNSVKAELIAMRAQLRILNLNIAVLTGQLNKEIAIKLAEGKPL